MQEVSEEESADPEFGRIPRRSTGVREESRMKLKAMGTDALSVDREIVELGQVEQLVDPEQTMALAFCLKYALQNLFDGKRSLKEAVSCLVTRMEEEGLSELTKSGGISADLAMPRPQEIHACFNRYRELSL